MGLRGINSLIDDAIDRLFANISSNSNNFTGRNGDIVNQIMIPVTKKYGKATGKRLISGYDVKSSVSGNGEITFTLINDATDPQYKGYYFWTRVDQGRPKVKKFSGTRKGDAFYDALDRWKSTSGFTGSTFWLAVNINTRGIKGTPELFDEIRVKTKDFLRENGFDIIK